MENVTEFTCVGIHHVFSDDGVALDQTEYIGSLKPVKHHKMIGLPAEAEVDDELAGLYASLLGALAFALMTQHWAAVYAVALQRKARKPQAIDVRRLNAVVRKAQQSPISIVYEAIEDLRVLPE